MADHNNRDNKGRHNDPKNPQKDIDQKGGESSRDINEMEDINELDK